MTIASRVYWDAWHHAEATRYWTDWGSPQSITRAEINAWLDSDGYDDPEERSDLMGWVLWLDGEFRRLHSEQAEAKRKRDKPLPKKPARKGR